MMTDNEYIRAAVELADDWSWTGPEGTDRLQPLSQPFKDALAAQLVRQVEAMDEYGVMQWAFNDVEVRKYHATDNPLEAEEIVASAEGPDRTMNTIKVIVDSGVLTTK